PTEDAVHDEVGGVAQHLRAEDDQSHADDGEHEDDDQKWRVGAHAAQQALDRSLEVEGLLHRDARGAPTAAAHGRPLVDGLLDLLLFGLVGHVFALGVAHAASWVRSWDSTISA